MLMRVQLGGLEHGKIVRGMELIGKYVIPEPKRQPVE
jgi:hypothetical protein